jgi:tripartite-type tricarboxylate transporter receptor subunit TctC
VLAAELSNEIGQQVYVENRPGGAFVIGNDAVAKSPPDGYTLYLGGVTTLALAIFLQKNIQYDPVRDFQPVSQTTISPLLLMTHPTLPARNVKELVALARAQPGQINYASSGPGGSGHLAGELFKSVTKTNLVHVPYRGAPPALTGLIAGQVQTMFGTMLASVPHIRSGKLRALAVTGPQRSSALPEVPNFAESGLPGYDASSWNGILVPAGTPRPIVDRLNSEIVKIMRTPGVLDRLSGDGPIAVGNSPEEFGAFIKAEQVKWGKVIREANIRIE